MKHIHLSANLIDQSETGNADAIVSMMQNSADNRLLKLVSGHNTIYDVQTHTPMPLSPQWVLLRNDIFLCNAY